MGIVPHGEQPVSYRESQVVLVELDEGRVELRSFAHATCKGICLKLKPATQDRQAEGQQLKKTICPATKSSQLIETITETIFFSRTLTSL